MAWLIVFGWLGLGLLACLLACLAQAKEIPLGSLGLLAWFPKGTFAK